MASQGEPPSRPHSGVVRIVLRLSGSLLSVEKFFVSGLIAAIAGLILLNVFTRYLNYALYWVDEAVIYTMVWATLVGASICLRHRLLIAVTLLEGFLGERIARVVFLVVDFIVLLFGFALIWFCWLWFAPLDFWRAGFSVSAFILQTGNFIYAEPTLTIGIRKAWVWLIMPIFALTFTIHALANFLERLATDAPNRAQANSEDAQ